MTLPRARGVVTQVQPLAGLGRSPAATSALSMSFLQGLPEDVLSGVLEKSRETGFGAATTVQREGAPASAAIIVSGQIRFFLTSPDGRQVTVRYARAGDLVGTPLGTPMPSLSAKTVKQSSILVLDLPSLLAAARRNARLSWSMSEELNLQLGHVLDQLALNAFGTLRQRIVENLVTVAVPGRRSRLLVAHLSQQDLADTVGSVREAVARVLRELRRAGLVKTSPLAITLLEPGRLRAEMWSRAAPAPLA